MSTTHRPTAPNPDLERAWTFFEDLLGSPYWNHLLPAADRREMFLGEIRRIEAQCNVDVVLVALWDAKHEASRTRGQEWGLDVTRKWKDTRAGLLRDVEDLVARLHRFARDPFSQLLRAAHENRPVQPWRTEDPPRTLDDLRRRLEEPIIPEPSPVQRSADALRDAVQADPVFQQALPGPDRRPAGRGHQPEPWLARVRQRLRDAHVPKESREVLLEAVGLKRSAA